MNVVFEDETLDDLQRIFDWIAEVNRPAAEKLVERLFDRAESLAAPELTYTGRPGLDPGLAGSVGAVVPAKAATHSPGKARLAKRTRHPTGKSH